MPTLSLTLIVKNEEIHIPQVLANAHHFADEIVIVDSGSTDRTRELAQRYSARIIDFEWCDNFAKARNAGLAECRMDYVLWLDADDVVEEADAIRLRQIVDGPKDWDVLLIPYHYARDANGRTTILQLRERLFRRDLGLEFEYPIHECLRFPPGLRVGKTSDIKVIHNNLRRQEPSNTRNLRVLRNAVETDEYRHSFRMWWLLAREESPEISVLLFHKVLAEFASQPGFDPGLHGQVWYELGKKLYDLQRWDEALEAFGRAFSLYPLRREGLIGCGKVLWLQQRYPEALGMLQLAGTIPPPPPDKVDCFDPELYDGEEYYEWLFVASYSAGNLDQARETIAHGLRVNPRSSKFRQRALEYGLPTQI